MHKRLLSLSVLIITLALLIACAAPATTETPNDTTSATDGETESEQSESARDTLRMPYQLFYGAATNLDPAGPVRMEAAIIMLYDRLVRLDENGAPAPELATTWESNEDATVWTFTLQEGVTFHNGQAFSSADVLYTFDHIFDPTLESPLAPTYAIVEEVTAPDESTVAFMLSQAYADFPLLLTEYAARIIPVDSAETIAETGIGTGPFKLESLDVEGTTRLVANDEYWAGQPQLAAVEIYSIPDENARVQALQAGQLDLLPDATAQTAALFAGNADYSVLTFPGIWTGLVFRTDTAPFDDVRVRKALRMVADRQAMIALVLDGEGTVSCDTPVLPNDLYRWEGECPQDIEGAQALLAEAGYGDGLDITIYASATASQVLPLAEVYQQQAAQAGINVTIEQVPADSYWTDVWLQESAYITFYLPRPADSILNLLWRSDAAWNETAWMRPDFDQLLDDARTELDADARGELYQEAQRILWEEGGLLIPFHANNAIVYNSRITGIQPMAFLHWQWHIVGMSE